MLKKSGPRITKDLMITYSGIAVTSVVYFVYTLVLSRLVGPYQWGLYNLSKSAVSILMTIALIGINTALVKYIPELISKKAEKSAMDKIISSATYIVLISTPIVATIWYFVAPLIAEFMHDTSLVFYFRLSILWFVTGVMYNFVSDILRSHKFFKPYNFIKIINVSVLGISAVIFAIVISKDAKWLITAEVLSFVLAVLFGLFYVIKLVRPKLTRWGRNERKKLFEFGIPMAPSALLLLLVNALDRFFIGHFLNVENVGYYAVAGTFILSTAIIFDPISIVFFPNFASLITDSANHEKIKKYLSSLMNIVLFVGVAMVMIFFFMSPSLIKILFGEAYLPAVVPLKIISLNILFYGFHIVFRSLISVAHKTTVFLKLMGSAIIVSIAMNLLLVPKFGLIGASWASALAYITLAVMTLFYCHKKFKFEFKNIEFMKLIGALLILAPLLYLSNKFSVNIYILILTLVGSGVIYLAILRFFRVSWLMEGLGNIFKKQ